MSSNRLRSERFRETIAHFLRLRVIKILPRIPLDRRSPRLSDAVAQASHILAGDHFSLTVSIGSPLDVSGRLRAAEAHASEDGRAYPVAVIQRPRNSVTGEQFAVISLETLAQLIQVVEHGRDDD